MKLHKFLWLLILIPLCLSCWQIYRYNIKISYQNALQMESIESVNLQEWQKTNLSCSYIPRKDIFLYDSRVYAGKTGFSLVSACEKSDGKIILVNRGFVINKNNNFDNHLDKQLDEQVVIRFFNRPNYFTPDNSSDLWFFLDHKAAEQFLNLKLENYFVQILSGSKEFPLREELKIEIKNNHLGYAMMWLTLALIYWIFLYNISKKSL